MAAIASVNGSITSLSAAQVPVVDRGFLYGDAVFEALRTYGRKPDALDQHLERLQRSCAIVGIELGVSRQRMTQEVLTAIAAAEGLECYVRIMVTRGDHPLSLSPTGAGAARRVVLVRPLDPAAQHDVNRGIAAVSCCIPPSPMWAGAKPTSYLANLLAVGAAERAGADDAILLGPYGELLEGATSSVFLVQGDVLLTPPLSLGILPGITRDRVVAAAQRSGIEVRERLLTIRDAYRAEELFLTSSVRRVAAVVRLDGRSVGAGKVGPLTRRVALAYEREVATQVRA